MEVKFEVLGAPVGKGRPRFRTHNGRVHSYTPEKTENYENLVRLSYSLTVGQKQLQGPIKAKIMAYFPIPKSATKKFKTNASLGREYHIHKPDADNVIKAILDALNGVAYHDDNQVVVVEIEKRYSDEPRAEVTLIELSEEDSKNEVE